MSHGTVRLGIGARLVYDGEAVEVVEFAATGAGNEVVLKDGRGRMLRVSVKELLFSDRATIVPRKPEPARGMSTMSPRWCSRGSTVLNRNV
ncbi:hypothetical protein ACTWPT_52620 [Nonomuraea sp. 3N208]|uniref:hypothetical protein n=1 Tax=Nonomuraea sp. 3N208 TaxID=3457421 RepID=UPI003FD4FFF5